VADMLGALAALVNSLVICDVMLRFISVHSFMFNAFEQFLLYVAPAADVLCAKSTCRRSLFTFVAYSALLYKSVRGAFQNAGGKLREIYLADSVAVGNPLVPRLFACFLCRNSVRQRYK